MSELDAVVTTCMPLHSLEKARVHIVLYLPSLVLVVSIEPDVCLHFQCCRVVPAPVMIDLDRVSLSSDDEKRVSCKGLASGLQRATPAPSVIVQAA